MKKNPSKQKMKFITKYMLQILISMLAVGCSYTSNTPEISSNQNTKPETINTAVSTPYPLPLTAKNLAILPAYPPPFSTPIIEHHPDCFADPDISICIDQEGELQGKLAYIDSQKYVNVIDLTDGTSWQILRPAKAVSWSPFGELLLVAEETGHYSTYDQLGQVQINQKLHQYPLKWTNDNDLQTLNTYTTAQGSQAQIQAYGPSYTYSLTTTLQIHSPEKTQEWVIDRPSPDMNPNIVDLVPNTSLALLNLVHGGTATQATTGNALFVMDINNGSQYDVAGKMIPPEEYDWHPTERGLIVFADSSNHPVGRGQSLSILNLLSNEYERLTDGAQVISNPSWSPNGRFIAYSVFTPAGLGDDATTQRGIFIIDPLTHEQTQLTTPERAIDVLPQWSTDGRFLIYGRWYPEESKVELRVTSLDNSFDETIATNLTEPLCQTRCQWNNIISYAP